MAASKVDANHQKIEINQYGRRPSLPEKKMNQKIFYLKNSQRTVISWRGLFSYAGLMLVPMVMAVPPVM
jgi:hypothetical protein